MLNLKDFILENTMSDQEMRKYILDAINNMDSNQLSKTYKAFVNSNFQTSSLISYLKDRGVDDIWKQIYRIFKDNSDDLDLLIQMIEGKIQQPDTNAFLSSNNVRDLFGENGLGFSKELIDDLINIRTPKSSIARGPFEVLCLCLLKDIAPENDAKKCGKNRSSDVNTTDGVNGCLEFKGDDARIKGMSLKSPEFIDVKMSELMKDKLAADDLKKLTKIFSSQANIENILNQIIVPVIKDENELQHIISISIAEQFEDDALSIVEPYIKYIWKEIFKNGKFNKKIFSKVFGVLDMHFYQKTDLWDNMIVFGKNKSAGEYVVVNKNEVQDPIKFWKECDKKVHFTGNPNYGSPLEYAVHIHKA